jgi:hypothetical protein
MCRAWLQCAQPTSAPPSCRKSGTVLELLLARLDEQGLKISSPWETSDEEYIVDVLWSQIHKAWLENERWAGCTEIIEEVRTEWGQAQLCLKACGKLSRSQPAIFSVAQLRGSHTWWMHPEEVRSRQCQLTMPEYTALTSWLPAPHVRRVDETAVGLEASAPDAGEASPTCCGSTVAGGIPSKRICLKRAPLTPHAGAVDPVKCPQFIGGQIASTLLYDQLLLHYSPQDCLPEVDISNLSDSMLLGHLSRGRAVFPYPRNDNDTLMVECLLPLRKVVSPYPFSRSTW